MKILNVSEEKIIIISYALLLVIGSLEVWSASMYFSYVHFFNENFIFKKDLMYLFAAIFISITFYFIDYKLLKKFSFLIIVASILSLIMLYIGFGVNIRGSTRWLNIGFLFEPSDPTKLAFLIYLADFISRKRELVKDYKKGFLPIAFVVGIIFLLVAKEPDIGTAFLIILSFVIIIYVFGYRFSHIMTLIFPSLVVLALIIITHPNKLSRLKYFFDKSILPFQVKQSLIALSNGGIFGQGLGNGIYKTLFLPDSYNDFIMASIGEDCGFFGLFVVILVLISLVSAIFSTSKKCSDEFGKVLSFGIGIILTLQILINVGTAVYLIPPKGITMPFISYGGTSMIIDSVMVGIILNITKHIKIENNDGKTKLYV